MAGHEHSRWVTQSLLFCKRSWWPEAGVCSGGKWMVRCRCGYNVGGTRCQHLGREKSPSRRISGERWCLSHSRKDRWEEDVWESGRRTGPGHGSCGCFPSAPTRLCWDSPELTDLCWKLPQQYLPVKFNHHHPCRKRARLKVINGVLRDWNIPE